MASQISGHGDVRVGDRVRYRPLDCVGNVERTYTVNGRWCCNVRVDTDSDGEAKVGDVIEFATRDELTLISRATTAPTPGTKEPFVMPAGAVRGDAAYYEAATAWSATHCGDCNAVLDVHGNCPECPCPECGGAHPPELDCPPLPAADPKPAPTEYRVGDRVHWVGQGPHINGTVVEPDDITPAGYIRVQWDGASDSRHPTGHVQPAEAPDPVPTSPSGFAKGQHVRFTFMGRERAGTIYGDYEHDPDSVLVSGPGNTGPYLVWRRNVIPVSPPRPRRGAEMARVLAEMDRELAEFARYRNTHGVAEALEYMRKAIHAIADAIPQEGERHATTTGA